MGLLMPKRVKHRKWRKRTYSKGIDRKSTQIAFGSFALESYGEKWVSSRQIEAARRVIIRYMRKGGKLWLRIFPDKPVTKKGTEVPMGGGKGSVDHYVFPLRPGRIIFEIDGLSEKESKEALRKAGDKLPLKTKIIRR